MRTNSAESRAVHFEAVDSSRRYFVQCAIISNGEGSFWLRVGNALRNRQDGYHVI